MLKNFCQILYDCAITEVAISGSQYSRKVNWISNIEHTEFPRVS